MRELTRQIGVALLSCSLVAVGWPGTLRGAGQLPVGESTAGRAAAARLVHNDALVMPLFAGAFSDTIGYEFPDEEPETRNVVKDIALYTIVAGFVAFFIIKVFLEGDTEETEQPPPGKDPPPLSSLSHPTDDRRWP